MEIRKNKPKRVFGLLERCREFDVFKMSGIFEKLFGVFLHILEILGIFLELFFKFLVNFSEFLGIFLGKIVCEDFLRGLLKGFFWEEFFFYIGID